MRNNLRSSINNSMKAKLFTEHLNKLVEKRKLKITKDVPDKKSNDKK